MASRLNLNLRRSSDNKNRSVISPRKHRSPGSPPGLGIMNRLRKESSKAKSRVKERRHSQYRRLSYDTHYKVYRKQIEEHKFDERTKMSFRDLGMLAMLYDRRWIYEDIISAVVLFQLLLTLVIEMRTENDLRGDDMATFSCKCMMSISSIALVWLLAMRRRIVLKKLKLRNILPRHSQVGFFSWGFVLEALVLGFHVPPFVDYLITTHEENVAHVNMYNFLVLAKSYTFLRVCRNHSGFYGSHTNFIGNLNGVDSMSILFNFRMLLKYVTLKYGKCRKYHTLEYKSKPLTHSNCTTDTLRNLYCFPCSYGTYLPCLRV